MLSIRTQDRMALVPYNNVIHINELTVIESGKLVYELIIDNSFHSLGTYATKERALEVLDEIQKALLGNDTTRYEYFTRMDGTQKIEYTYIYKTVYKMPQDK